MNHDKSQWPITSDLFAQTRKMPSNGGSGYFVCCVVWIVRAEAIRSACLAQSTIAVELLLGCVQRLSFIQLLQAGGILNVDHSFDRGQRRSAARGRTSWR